MGEGRAFKIICLKDCALELGVTPRYTRELFSRTEFLPVFRINQVAFYLSYNFASWKLEHWQLCTLLEACTA